MTSPFRMHRDKVLGYYGTAAWLRQVVMALWSGSATPVGLSNLQGVDDDHFKAFIDMVTHYRRVGESDLAFRQLVEEVQARHAAERQAVERAMAYEAWSREAAGELPLAKRQGSLMTATTGSRRDSMLATRPRQLPLHASRFPPSTIDPERRPWQITKRNASVPSSSCFSTRR